MKTSIKFIAPALGAAAIGATLLLAPIAGADTDPLVPYGTDPTAHPCWDTTCPTTTSPPPRTANWTRRSDPPAAAQLHDRAMRTATGRVLNQSIPARCVRARPRHDLGNVLEFSTTAKSSRRGRLPENGLVVTASRRHRSARRRIETILDSLAQQTRPCPYAVYGAAGRGSAVDRAHSFVTPTAR